eukprot:scaffold2563_cov139-Skeletonema_marinoi.AAC.7
MLLKQRWRVEGLSIVWKIYLAVIAEHVWMEEDGRKRTERATYQNPSSWLCQFETMMKES